MHPIRRKIVIGLFALGALAGFSSEFAHHRCCQRNRQQAWEQHVARVCIDAARNSQGAAGGPVARGTDAYPGGGW